MSTITPRVAEAEVARSMRGIDQLFVSADEFLRESGIVANETALPGNPNVVSAFEGKTCQEILRTLQHGRRYSKFVGMCEWYLKDDTTGDPKRIDKGIETLMLAFSLRPKSKEEKRWDYSQLLRAPIQWNDLTAYAREGLAPQLLERYHVGKVNHPLARRFNQLTSFWDSFRGLAVFDKLPDMLLEQWPALKTRRAITMLYPAGGSHIAPLLTTMRLIENGAIDHAELIYTEIDAGNFIALIRLLHDQLGDIFSNIQIGRRIDFPNAGWERTIHIKYQQGQIDLRFAYQRSGKEYYRREYVAAADIVILHDSGAPSLLFDILLNKQQVFPSKIQFLLTESAVPPMPLKRHPKRDEKIFFDSALNGVLPNIQMPSELPGQYGCCNPSTWEMGSCFNRGAWLFSLQDSPLLAFVAQHDSYKKFLDGLRPFVPQSKP